MAERERVLSHSCWVFLLLMFLSFVLLCPQSLSLCLFLCVLFVFFVSGPFN